MVSTAKLFCQLYWIIEIATCKNSNHVEKKNKTNMIKYVSLLFQSVLTSNPQLGNLYILITY